MVVGLPVFGEGTASLLRAFRNESCRIMNDERVRIGKDGIEGFVSFSIVEFDDSPEFGVIAEDIQEHVPDETRVFDDLGFESNGKVVVWSVTDGESSRASALVGETWVWVTVLSKACAVVSKGTVPIVKFIGGDTTALICCGAEVLFATGTLVFKYKVCTIKGNKTGTHVERVEVEKSDLLANLEWLEVVVTMVDVVGESEGSTVADFLRKVSADKRMG